MRQNLHTHTVFGDGKHTAEELVLAAMEQGCGSLGFSEHSPLPPALDPDGWTMKAEQVPVYRREILRLREQYAGQLELFLGLEQDIDSPSPADPYDYLIGSVHGIWVDGVYCSVDESAASMEETVRRRFGGDYAAYVQTYYRRVAEVAEKTGCSIIGHLDLVTKFNEGGRFFDPDDHRCLSPALEAAEALLSRDVIFEVNTGAMSRGYRTQPYPAPTLLRFLREHGGRVCITSDCHNAAHLLYAFDQAAEFVSQCGFSEVWKLTNVGFVSEPV
jgi:histidinol-phosphatase (PHP family)